MGCSGGYACSGCSNGCSNGYMAAPAMAPAIAPPPVLKKDGEKGGEKAPDKAPEKEINTPATIQVSLPADAKLSIDDAPTTSTSASRTFATPALEQGKVFYYTLKAEIVRDGKTLSATSRVAVRAGEESRVSIEIPTATVAAK